LPLPGQLTLAALQKFGQEGSLLPFAAPFTTVRSGPEDDLAKIALDGCFVRTAVTPADRSEQQFTALCEGRADESSNTATGRFGLGADLRV